MDMMLKKARFLGFLEKVGETYDVYGPTHLGGGTADYSYPTFGRLGKGRPLITDYHVTMTTLKNQFFPDSQTLYEWEDDGTKVDVRAAESDWERPRAFVGVHPCDIGALERLDRVLLQDKYVDGDYRGRRNSSVIIGLTCNECGDSCFCNTSGSGPDSKSGFDLLLTDIGESYYVRSGSEVGEEMLAWEGFEEVTKEAEAERARRIAEVEAALPVALDCQSIAVKIRGSDMAEVLQSLASRCFTCGACNMVCPTCHCFTFVDRMNSEKTRGSRSLIWDACHYAKFGTMAGNVNPRPEEASRFRHRIFDKFCYDYDRYGEIFCVGCGRCLEFCPGHINIREAAEAIQGAQHE
jgi:ferredoxin